MRWLLHEPKIHPFLRPARQRGLSVDDLDRICEQESGLRAIGGTSDMRSLLGEASTDPRAAVAVAMFGYAICKAVGAFAAAMGDWIYWSLPASLRAPTSQSGPPRSISFLPG